MRCRISGSISVVEIPLLIMLLYLLFHKCCASNVCGRRTSSDREFGWGGTSAKLQRRCPKVDSERTEIFRGLKGEKSA
jgi:hypothetical protein